MSVLIIGDYDNYKGVNHFHFSLTKGFELAKGWTSSFSSSSLDTVYFLTTGISELYEGVYLKNADSIDRPFLESLSIILFIRETSIHIVLENCNAIKRYIENRKRKTKLGVKSDSAGWVQNKQFRTWTRHNYNCSVKVWAYKVFDIIYCQTQELLDIAKREFFVGDPLNKLRISAMAVPESILSKEEFENPYTIDHAYCVSNANKLGHELALFPLCYSEAFAHIWKFDEKDKDAELRKAKTILLYTGRMKIDNGNVLFILRDIMKELGDDYELHIFPGSFVIPGINCTNFSCKNSNHIQLIRDIVFPNSPNIIIHFPYQHENRFKYLYYADVGLDFSQSRPTNIRSPQGNAKLLEYCSVGLPTITERNVNNSHLIDDGKNGILLDGIATVSDYVAAIKRLIEMRVDRQEAQRITLENNNWRLRALNIVKDFSE